MAPGVLFLLALLLYLDTSGMILLSLLAGILHECGHWFALDKTKNSVRRFSLTLFGAKIEPRYPMTLWQEFAVAAAGPAVNLLLAVIFSRLPGGSAFAGVNLALGAFNLLPVLELDGARMLRSVLFLCLPVWLTEVICGCLDFCFTLLFSCLGVWFSLHYGNLSLLLMCLWLISRHREGKCRFFRKRMGKGLVRWGKRG